MTSRRLSRSGKKRPREEVMSGLIFLLLVVGASAQQQPQHLSGHWTDFEFIVHKFAKKQADTLKRTIQWVDPFGRHEHLRERPQYSKYQSSARIVGRVRYGDLSITSTKPAWSFNSWYHNNMSLPVTARFSKIKAVQDSFTWSVEGGVRFAAGEQRRNFTFIVPPQLGLDKKTYNKTFDADEIIYGFKAEKSVIEYDKFNISQELIIPPHKSVEASLVIQGKEATAPWSADVQIDGYFAVWYKRKYNGHYLWFYPVGLLSGEDNRFIRSGAGLRYTIKGEFDAVYSTTAHLYLQEFDYKKPEHI